MANYFHDQGPSTQQCTVAPNFCLKIHQLLSFRRFLRSPNLPKEWIQSSPPGWRLTSFRLANPNLNLHFAIVTGWRVDPKISPLFFCLLVLLSHFKFSTKQRPLLASPKKIRARTLTASYLRAWKSLGFARREPTKRLIDEKWVGKLHGSRQPHHPFQAYKNSQVRLVSLS